MRRERADARGHALVEGREARQLGQDEKAGRADHVVRNDGSIADLERELSGLVARIAATPNFRPDGRHPHPQPARSRPAREARHPRSPPPDGCGSGACSGWPPSSPRSPAAIVVFLLPSKVVQEFLLPLRHEDIIRQQSRRARAWTRR